MSNIEELTSELKKIREEGVRAGSSKDQISKKILLYIMDYRKRNTLSPADLERLKKESEDLTERMLARLEKIKRLAG